MFNLINDIPQHRLLSIRDSNGDVLGNYPLIMDNDVSIKASSSFGQLWEGSSNALMTLLSSSLGLPSGQFAMQGTQIWKSTDPITFNLNANLEMDKDPYKEVVMNTSILMNLCLPSLATDKQTIARGIEDFAEKHLNLKLKTLIPPGPNLQALMSSMGNGNEEVQNILKNNRYTESKGVYDVNIGFLKIPNVILKSVEPTFSKIYSKSPSKPNKKYPIRAELSIEFTTMEVATTNMITQIFSNI